MKPEEQRIRIAEACGWKWKATAHIPFGAELANSQWHNPQGKPVNFIPDYTSDLNAMHEAEKTLTAEQQLRYAERLHVNGSRRHYLHVDYDAITATAAQRAEAFLKTIGKWSV